jgi:hypothetical protein
MWTPQAAKALAYKAGVIFNSGFAGQAITNDDVENGGIAPPTKDSPYVVAYVRVSEPQKGDEIEITLTGPDGKVLATKRFEPMEKDLPQAFQLVGRKRPATGWPGGRYVAELKVWRAGKVAMQKRLDTTL